MSDIYVLRPDEVTSVREDQEPGEQVGSGGPGAKLDGWKGKGCLQLDLPTTVHVTGKKKTRGRRMIRVGFVSQHVLNIHQSAASGAFSSLSSSEDCLDEYRRYFALIISQTHT